MSRSIADEREHRRGLILGLTLAEVLLLLMFLLLLALGSRMVQLERDAKLAGEQLNAVLSSLRPLQDELTKRGALTGQSLQELVARLKRLDQLETRVSELQQENVALSAQVSVIKQLGGDADKKLRNVMQLIQKAAEINPNDPAVYLKRALEVMDRLGASTQPDEAGTLSEMSSSIRKAAEINPNDPAGYIKRALAVMDRLGPATRPEQVGPLLEMVTDDVLRQRLASIEADRDKMRSERDNLMRSGNGRTYPSCWRADPGGQTEYIFDVTLTDRGVVVHNVAPPTRAQDPAWTLISEFPRDVEIRESTFISATAKLAAWSKDQKQNCRFYTINHDSTGQTNKERYKQVRSAIEQNFYPFFPPSQRGSLSPIRSNKLTDAAPVVR